MSNEFLESLDTQNRFSKRVDDYVKYRPSYPFELIEFMEREHLLKKGYVVADIGAGTGKFTELLLKANYKVIAVEPNEPMLSACKKIYGKNKNLTCQNGSSEKTNLPDKSVDLITTAQAFHWFKLEETKIEWRRILKPNKYIALVWNSRKKGENAPPFLQDYEQIVMQFGTDYQKLQENFLVQEKIIGLFGENGYKEFHTIYQQRVNFEELKGRILSSSYIPQADSDIYPKMVVELKRIFRKHQIDNQVTLDYDTELYYGKLD